MKKIKLAFPIFLMLLTCQCERDKCDAFSGRVLSGKMQTYFGPYKPGNWWVYQNQDSTKQDSVYVKTFVDSLIKNEANCTAYSLRKFSLFNTYLGNMNDIAVTYDATETAISFMMEAQSISLPGFTSSSDSLIRSLPAADNPGINTMDSVRLNDSTYHNILIGKKIPNTYYFGKDKGLVGWITLTDTFNLVNSRIL
jgi:hypothetical protein